MSAKHLNDDEQSDEAIKQLEIAIRRIRRFKDRMTQLKEMTTESLGPVTEGVNL